MLELKSRNHWENEITIQKLLPLPIVIHSTKEDWLRAERPIIFENTPHDDPSMPSLNEIIVEKTVIDHFGFGKSKSADKGIHEIINEGSGNTEKLKKIITKATNCIDQNTGILRSVYKQLVIVYAPKTTRKQRQKIQEKFHLDEIGRSKISPDMYTYKSQNTEIVGKAIIELVNDIVEEGLPEIYAVCPDFISKINPSSVPNEKQWHLTFNEDEHNSLNIIKAWDVTEGHPDIVVAVLDDGVAIGHPNLKDNILTGKGRDFTFKDNEPNFKEPTPKHKGDDHGTSCAGLIAAVGREGIFGIAPKCKILPIRVMGKTKGVRECVLKEAIKYAAQHSDILSMSFYMPHNCIVSEQLYAVKNGKSLNQKRKNIGAPIFSAAGNKKEVSGFPDDYFLDFPASDASTISVGAITKDLKKAGYSQTGKSLTDHRNKEILHLLASSSNTNKNSIGNKISTTGVSYHNNMTASYGVNHEFGGTSASTAIMAGAAALILSHDLKLNKASLARRVVNLFSNNTELNNHQLMHVNTLKNIMRNHCIRVDSSEADYNEVTGHSKTHGYGKLDLVAALNRLNHEISNIPMG